MRFRFQIVFTLLLMNMAMFFSYKLEKGKKQVIRKMYVNVREKMKEWGVEAEKGEGIKEEEKQRQYDEMIELRRQQRKKNSKQRSRLYKFKKNISKK